MAAAANRDVRAANPRIHGSGSGSSGRMPDGPRIVIIDQAA
jgi:hypothetical protein